MKRILYALLATVSGLVLLFSYRTSVDAVMPSETAPAPGTAISTPGTSTSGSSGGGGFADGTYTGATAQTRYGPVQVQITISHGQITDVQALDYPDGNGRDRQINGIAIPRLVSETLQSQSSQIQMVSGATYTSDGYMTSLQSAIDQAHS